MSKELYLNGQLVDLDEKDNPVASNFAVNNLAELKDRQAYATNVFKIPPTKRNLSICGFPDSPNIITEIPYRKIDAKLVQNGVEIIPLGYAIVNGMEDYIEVQVLSGIIGFFEAIEGKKLSDLDFSEYAASYTLVDVVSSQAHADGYIWPVIDYGKLASASQTVDIRQMRPAVFHKTILDKIVRDSGYTLNGKILDDDLYKKEIVAFANDSFVHGKRYLDRYNSYALRVSQNTDKTYTNPADQVNPPYINLKFNEVVVDQSLSFSGASLYTAKSSFRGAVQLVIPRMEFSGVTNLAGNDWTFVMEIVKKPSSGDVIVLCNYQFVCPKDVVSVFTNVTLLNGDFKLDTGDVVYIRINTVLGESANTVQLKLNSPVTFTITPIAGTIILGESIELEATLPDLNQKDFIKDFLQRKGLTVIPDPYTKIVTVVNMSEVYGNISLSKNWTKKFFNSVKRISYSLDGYGVLNYGKFKEDDAVPKDFGRGTMTLDNQSLKNEVDLLVSPFAATVSSVKLNGLDIALIRQIDQYSVDSAFTIKTEPRILISRVSDKKFYFIDGISTSDLTLSSVPYFKQKGLPGLGYDEAFETHYKYVIRMLYRPFIVSRKAYISEMDIINIDWTIPIFDEETSEYYYLNEINDYINGQDCQVSLIKL